MSERSSPKKKKHKKRSMFNFISNTVEKVFNQVYDGEPVRAKPRRRFDSVDTILEEEVLFCKNNICVHTVIQSNQNGEEEHNPGYLCFKKIYRSDDEISDLMVSWVPNSLLTVGSTEEAEVATGHTTPSESIIPENPINCASNGNHNGNLENLPTASPSKLELATDFETPLGDVFSVNLIDMKTVKLFYANPSKDSGQFVIGSHENEYKVFHFHNTGLVKVTEIFNEWKGCTIDNDLVADEVGQQVYYIQLGTQPIGENGRDLHPEEGRYRPMNMISWQTCINQLGQIEDGYNFRKHVFFAGLSQEVRPDAWKYLLYYYPMHSTGKEREAMVMEKKKSYGELHDKRLALSGEEYETFWKKVQFTVDKDVVRTDRSHPYYAGQDNPNIQKMRNILLNYAIYNPEMGYTQGMSDLVAPLLATLHSEVDSFWCFVGLMEFSMFATTPTDQSMDKSLGFLRELLRIILPEFYMHCLCQDYDLNLLFVHRWLVLCFKREFIFHEVLKIWEACWARYQTDYFHIFICVALVSLYCDVCMEKKMDADEILQYFTDMATKFDGSAVLKEARSILYKFRQMNRIPCTLRGLLSGKGVWDGGISPEVECASNHQRCCFEYKKQDKKSEDPVDIKGFKNTVDNQENEEIPTPKISSEIEPVSNQQLNIPPSEMLAPSEMLISEEERLVHTELYKSDNNKQEFSQLETVTSNEQLTDSSKNDVETEQKIASNNVANISLDDKFMPDDKFSNANIY